MGEIVRTAMFLSRHRRSSDSGSNSVLLEREIDPLGTRWRFPGNLYAITVEQMRDTAEKMHVLDDEKVQR